MKKYIIGIMTLLLSVTNLSAQEATNLINISDTTPALSKRELRKQKVAQRNLHYNILGGRVTLLTLVPYSAEVP